MAKRAMLALSACTAMTMLLLPSIVVSAQLSPAPQNHRVIDGECVTAELAPDDFCRDVVTYAIPSTLLQESGLIPPIKEGRDLPQALLDNRLDLLSNRAQAEFELLIGHHLEAANLRADSPGGVRHTAAAKGLDPSTVELPNARACEETLRKYVCQNQFPRCIDDQQYTEPGQPIELHTCYSLCHAVRNTCALAHRLDCVGHHHKLNPLWEQPSEHALRFDPEYADGADPYAEFWMVDCIDAPPNSWKHLTHYLLYGGPAKWTLFTIAAMVLYACIAALMGFNTESQTAVLLKLRQERRAKRAAFDQQIRRFQKKYVRLQEIKTVMLEAQAKEMRENPAAAAAAAAAATGQEVAASAASSSPASPASAFSSPRAPVVSSAASTSLRDRAAKLSQLDALLAQLESDIDLAYRAMSNERLEEVRADYAAGRVPPSIGEAEIRAYVAGTTDALSVGSIGGGGPELNEDEREAINEEEEMLLRARADNREDYEDDLDAASSADASAASMALSPASSASPSRVSKLASPSSRFEAHSTPMDGEEEGYEEVKQTTQRRR